MPTSYTITLNDNVVSKLQTIVGGVDISPLVLFKANQKVVVDFSVGTYYFNETGAYLNNIAYNSISVDDEQTGSHSSYDLIISENSGQNQLIASIGGFDGEAYISLSNEVVIYEGDVSQISDTSTIASQLPKVEFTLTNDYKGKVVIEVNPDYSITN